jgi:hypothetical protein
VTCHNRLDAKSKGPGHSIIVKMDVSPRDCEGETRTKSEPEAAEAKQPPKRTWNFANRKNATNRQSKSWLFKVRLSLQLSALPVFSSCSNSPLCLLRSVVTAQEGGQGGCAEAGGGVCLMLKLQQLPLLELFLLFLLLLKLLRQFVAF